MAPGSALPRDIRTVFLDRDGVLNAKAPEGEYVKSWKEFQVLPGVPEAVARLNRAGLRTIVVSNQRGIARGLYTVEDVEALHGRLQELLKEHGAHIDAFFICPHREGECNCRKPLTGLYEQAVARFPEISAAASVMVGDSAADMEFGRRLGMATVWVEGDPQHRAPGAASACASADARCYCLAEAVELILCGG